MLLLFRPRSLPDTGSRGPLRRHYGTEGLRRQEAERLAVLLDEDDLLIAPDLLGG